MATVSRPSAVLDLNMERGSTFDMTIAWTSGGVAVDLTGCTAVMDIRPSEASDTLYYTLSTSPGDDDGTITLGDTAGTIQLTIPAEDSVSWTWRRAVYDLEITFASGVVKKPLRGKITSHREVTRSA